MIIKVCSILLLLGGLQKSWGQSQFTISNLSKIPQKSYANPALTPTNLEYFVGIPLLSGIHLNGNSQGFRLKDIGWTKVFDPQVDYEMARQNLSPENIYRLDSRVDLLYGGIASKTGMFTLNFSERVIGDVAFPSDLFSRLADEEQGDAMSGRRYDLSGLDGNAMHFKEFAVAYAAKNRKGWNWGLRLKFLLGHEAIFTDNNQLVLMEDSEDGLMTSGDLAMRVAGFSHFSEEESFFRLFSAKNAGVAFDAGFDYRYNKRWQFFGSIHDLGGITWRKDLNLRELPESFSGLEPEIDNTFDRLVNDRSEVTKTFRVALPTQLRGGMRYHLKNNHILSAMASTRFYHTGTDLGMSIAYFIPVAPWLDWTASYSVFNKSFSNIGTGVAFQFGIVQVYFASDNIISAFSPTSTKNFHFQSGINLVWKKPEKKRRPTANREKIKPEDVMVTGGDNEEEAISYFTLKSVFSGEEDAGQEVNAIYVDIYRYDDSGNKELIHTSRYPNNEFEVTLYKISRLHELTVKVYGFEPVVYQFFPESEGLERKFKMTADPAFWNK